MNICDVESGSFAVSGKISLKLTEYVANQFMKLTKRQA